ncbi:TolC family outer membrane protein [Sphingomonas astaxanthinifaciens]|uniref:Type I secretion protein TolC n=1 Tax=Sphingomonas astaxanthinifaciens DSM 22298 TaxID=1123267 RepID=A0ABQ5Z9W2_9SPHN|nr:TolC family outer membrane protein [Sphingomonas astaxanthinifaciens]GLR47658.1 type I secretion protein TolC [Sphingomonas astaxanthinifaciens DSM 22298]
MSRLLACCAVAALALSSPAAADTLREALVSTYRTNPTLNAQREALKSTDANVAIARAGARPQVTGTVGVNRDLTRSGILDTGSPKGPTISGGVDLSVPLFQGGRVKNSIAAAKTRVEAGRATLRAVEGDVFTDAVAAYMDVIRDRAIVELNENQIKVLGTNLEATRDRFEIGDVTRTDVAQSESRLSLQRAQLANVQARLATSEENYRRIIGRSPDALASPPPLPPMPATADEAVRIAVANNPDVIAIVRQAEAAGIDVRTARADRLPTLSGVLSGDYVNRIGGESNGFPRSGTATSIGLNTRIPLYQGGAPAARIRQAQAIEGQFLEQVIGTERLVVANTRSAFATYEAAKRAIQSNDVAVSAASLALEGARAERSVGTRTVIEVLNAEQELLNAQVQLVTARRDAYVAGFQLLNAMGQAEADDLGLDGGPLYDPTGNYRRVAGNINDWSNDPRHVPQSTRTVTPAETPVAGPPAGVATPQR